MERRFDVEIKEVKIKLTKMSYMAMEAIAKSMKALTERNVELAQEVVQGDRDINSLNRSIEDSALKILLLDSPVAGDFRNVSAAMKMITDLERIGDYAVDIAEEVIAFPKEPYIQGLSDLKKMGEKAIAMVEKAIHSYVNSDSTEANSLEQDDDEVDKLYYKIKTELIELIATKKENAEQAILLMMIAKYLERIGDHAVNLGEWVEYASTGELFIR